MQEKFVKIDENKIRYLETGSGGPLVLVHGLGASAERWKYVIPLFEKRYQVIVPDLIGFGYSDKPMVDYTPEFFSDFLGKFLQEIKIERPMMIGSSLGGQVAVEYASNNDSIKKLILTSPSGMTKTPTPALDAYIMAALYPNENNAKNAFQMMATPEQAIAPEIISSFVERMKLPNAKMAFMSTLLGLKNAEKITTKLKSITAPTLIIWGALDPVIPIKHADSFVAAIKDCRFFRMDECGHTPYVDDPESFATIAMEFLKK